MLKVANQRAKRRGGDPVVNIVNRHTDHPS
jgi:hypothetical protein